MKKIFFFYTTFIIISTFNLKVLGIPSESYISIPDSNFEQFLVTNKIDKDGKINGQINSDDTKEVKILEIQGRGIKDISGIEAFTNIEYLDCSNNLLKSLDVSKNKKMKYLRCGINLLQSLDVSKNLNLTDLICERNQLISVNISGCTNLKFLDCVLNKLKMIDVSNNINLQKLFCGYNLLNIWLLPRIRLIIIIV